MNAQRLKALLQVKLLAEQHLGHTLIIGHQDKRKCVLKEVLIIRDNVMLKVDNEPFAKIYFEEVYGCTCESNAAHISF